MKNIYILLIALIGLLLQGNTIYAQSVGINTTGNNPDPSALLDLDAAPGFNKGLLIPRMTIAQRDAIVNPASGLQIYNTDCNTFNYNAGTPSSPNWATISSSAVPVAAVSLSASPAGAICSGTVVTFTASPTNGGGSPEYQWKLNGLPTGSNSTEYVSSNLNNGDVVTCTMISSEQCIAGYTATSNSVIVLVNAVPTITGTTPGSGCGAGIVNLAATASSGSINWFNAPDGGSVVGTGTTLSTYVSSTTTFYAEASAGSCTALVRAAVTATIYQTVPAQPGSISGPSENAGGLSSGSYSVELIPSTSYYSWSVPAGAIITGGQGTNSITVDLSCNASGDVTVNASNTCGSGADQVLAINTDLSTPGAITGPVSVSKNASASYSINAIPNAGNYTWTVNLGTITSGQGTNAIEVTWGAEGGFGSVAVVQSSACGTSTQSSLEVGINAVVFAYTASEQTYTIPDGVTSVAIHVYGAQGHDGNMTETGFGGLGGYATGTLAVSPGAVLYIYVGGTGNTYLGGYNGGGEGGNGNCCWGYGGGGGGGSDVRFGGNSLGDRIIIAGGGGGGGGYEFMVNDAGAGGVGGGLTGGTGANSYYAVTYGGSGGTQSSGGTGGNSPWAPGTDGSLAQGGNGINTNSYSGGGGGGGYYGGGGGSNGAGGAGGGGGSGYIGGVTDASMTDGVRSGNGEVIIFY